MRGLVEAELLFQAGDEFRIEALRAAVLGVHGVRAALTRLGAGAARAQFTAPAAETLGRADAGSGQLRDHALDRTARRELDDGE